MNNDTTESLTSVSTGVSGLNFILHGGYNRHQAHLIEGLPGVGKTTLALQFLVEGRKRGEPGLFVCISETRSEILSVAASHGFSMDGIDIIELLKTDAVAPAGRDQSIMHSADLELVETIALLMTQVRERQSRNIVIGSFSEIRYLAEEPLPYRRQVRTLLHYLAEQRCTVLLLESLTAGSDIHLESLVQCVIRLEQLVVPYGGNRRRLLVSKLRGRPFRGGYHDFVIRAEGLAVFPRLVTTDYPPAKVTDAPVTTGIAELDALLGGGIERGTTTIVRGPSGAGKSALALQPLNAALSRGEQAMFVSFDETLTNFIRRSQALGMPTASWLDKGALRFMRVDPAELSPGEFADTIRRATVDGVSAIVIDSLSGYQHAMPAENNLMLHLHELLTFLNEQGMITVLVIADGPTDGVLASPQYLTYLADTVILIRFYEADDLVRRAISVVKRRTGGHERGAREISFDRTGIRVGPLLAGFNNGVATLTGGTSGIAAAEPQATHVRRR